ncbi:hypothetical protein BJ165DRAFT_1321606, partial [Panaeolus papilionaceus]
WDSEMSALSQAERLLLEQSIRPVRLMLAKVRKVAFKTIHSSTLLLPAWKRCLKDLGIAIRLIPRDVRTRWNSTYDMLKFVLDHKRAYQSFTAD